MGEFAGGVLTRACSRAGEVGAAWEYISRVIRSIVKKPVRSSRWRSGLRILDNIDGVINRGGGKSKLVFPLSRWPISRNTTPDTYSFAPRSYAEHRSDGKTDGRRIQCNVIYILHAFHSWAWFTRHPGTICKRYLTPPSSYDRCFVV